MYLVHKLLMLINIQFVFGVPRNYHIVYDRAVVDSFNENYFTSFTIRNLKPNRTAKSVYAEYVAIKDLEKIYVSIKPFLFLSNEYKPWVAAEASYDYCKMLEKNIFGTWNLLQKYSNYTKCPQKKNTYYMTKLLPEDNDFPPNLPEGKYKLQVKFTTSNKVLLNQFSYYGSIESNKPLRRKN